MDLHHHQIAAKSLNGESIEGKRYMVGESHKIAELSVRFDEFQKRCVGA